MYLELDSFLISLNGDLLKNNNCRSDGVQVVELLLSKLEALSSNPSTTKKGRIIVDFCLVTACSALKMPPHHNTLSS
jgi:hypothetical protein